MAKHTTTPLTAIRDALLALKGGYESEDDPLTMYDDGIMSESAELVTSAYDELLALIDAASAAAGYVESYAELISADDPPHPETAAAWKALENLRAALR